ncbi:hypothetical protein K2X89_18270 [Myxococcota bacterium]|nr:hypothetical protein [Myxococcota bacterium]
MGLPFARIERDGNRAHPTGIVSWASDPPSLIEFFTLDGAGVLASVGELAERKRFAPPPDDCETSCFDWYGSVRPIFADDRILGLIGDELAEARLGRRGIRELQRLRMRGGP